MTISDIWLARGHALIGLLAGGLAWYSIDKNYYVWFIISLALILYNFYLCAKAYGRVKHENSSGL